MKTLLLGAAIAVGLAATGHAQAQRPTQLSPLREDSLDPSPVNPATDPQIGMFINDWRNAKPRTEYGKLVFHDILTSRGDGDMHRPVKKGAVLYVMTAVSRVSLAPGATAAGRMRPSQRQSLIATEGLGSITVNGRTFPIKDGAYFNLTSDFEFKMTNTGKVPLVFYARTEPTPSGWATPGGFTVFNRFENDRVFGAHWTNSCDMGPSTGPNARQFPPMTYCALQPYSFPQPHSHAGEEVWVQVKGRTLLSLGKNLLELDPGQAYKIPPSGMVAHANINLSDETTDILYLGPMNRPAENETVLARGIPIVQNNSRLEDRAINPPVEQEIDMFMNNWRDAWPAIRFGNMYVRDVLTSLEGADSLHPVRKGAVLTNATAVSYGLLEAKSSAHNVEADSKGIQQTFVVNSGTGTVTSGGKTTTLAKDMSFIVTPGMEWTVTASAAAPLTFYFISEKLPDGFKPNAQLTVLDNRSAPTTMTGWVDRQHNLVSKADGMSQYASVTRVVMGPMTMSRPTSAAADVEEIWIATDGDVQMLFGKRLRTLRAGTAYRVPSTGITARAHVNQTGKQASFLTFSKQGHQRSLGNVRPLPAGCLLAGSEALL